MKTLAEHTSKCCCGKCKTFEERFYSKVDKSPHPLGCWVWIGCKTRFGYGHMKVGQSLSYAHRLSWEMERGPIKNGLFVLHHCDNASCVNADHLFLGTKADNSRDCVSKDRVARQHGDSNPFSKLTSEEVSWIRRIWATKKLTQVSIAKIFNVHSTNIGLIVRGKSWKTVSL